MKRDPGALQCREHDLLVIGGGIAGAWTAWEAASRGLKVALVEIEDFGQATSWSSLKTAHGGLRHLQRADLGGFRESVRERRTLLRVAPEVVRPLAFAIGAHGLVERVKYALGGFANDVLSFDRNDGLRADRAVGSSGVLDAAEARALAGSAFEGVGAAFVWHDAQITHTERLLIGLLHAASEADAVVINRVRLDACARDQRGFALSATDLLTGAALRFRARAIVNAAGMGLEPVARLLGETCGAPKLIRGVNVVFGRDVTPGIAIGAKDRGKFLFAVPWLGQSMLGTIYDDGRSAVEPLVDELVAAGARAFPWAGIRRDDVTAVQAGHVPGAPDGSEPVYRSRLITHSDPRIVSVVTAKYTTARATAESAVNGIGDALRTVLRSSISDVTPLPQAVPLSGDVEHRIAVAMEGEMALTRNDAVRGRLIEGALGLHVPGGEA